MYSNNQSTGRTKQIFSIHYLYKERDSKFHNMRKDSKTLENLSFTRKMLFFRYNNKFINIFAASLGNFRVLGIRLFRLKRLIFI